MEPLKDKNKQITYGLDKDDDFLTRNNTCNPNTHALKKNTVELIGVVDLEKQKFKSVMEIAKTKGAFEFFKRMNLKDGRINLDFMYYNEEHQKTPSLDNITRAEFKGNKPRSTKNIYPHDSEEGRKTLELLKQFKILKPKSNILEKSVTMELCANEKYRDHMEDYINVDNVNREDYHVFVLCDGHSGHLAAENVAKTLPLKFDKSLKSTSEEESKENIGQRAITSAFEEMEDELAVTLGEINEKLEKDDEPLDLSGCCTNLIYLCIEDNKRVVYSGNVGDSRNILVRENKSLRISYDHKAIDPAEQKRCKEEDGIFIRKRLYGTLAITRALGDFEFKEIATCLSPKPYISRTEILDTDRFIVMASDGVWDCIKDSDVCKIVKSHDWNAIDELTKKPKDLAKMLVGMALELGSKDNISCIAIKLN